MKKGKGNRRRRPRRASRPDGKYTHQRPTGTCPALDEHACWCDDDDGPRAVGSASTNVRAGQARLPAGRRTNARSGAHSARTLWDADWDWPKPPPKVSLDEYPVDYTFVTDRIATGGGIWSKADVDTLAAAGITHVVTAADELLGPVAALVEGRMTWLGNGTLDDGKWKPAVWFANTVEFAKAALADPAAKVYLHCWSGKNRGPSSAYVVLRATGMTAKQAEDAIRQARPVARLLYRPDAEQALERMGIG